MDRKTIEHINRAFLVLFILIGFLYGRSLYLQKKSRIEFLKLGLATDYLWEESKSQRELSIVFSDGVKYEFDKLSHLFFYHLNHDHENSKTFERERFWEAQRK